MSVDCLYFVILFQLQCLSFAKSETYFLTELHLDEDCEAFLLSSTAKDKSGSSSLSLGICDCFFLLLPYCNRQDFTPNNQSCLSLFLYFLFYLHYVSVIANALSGVKNVGEKFRMSRIRHLKNNECECFCNILHLLRFLCKVASLLPISMRTLA